MPTQFLLASRCQATTRKVDELLIRPAYGESRHSEIKAKKMIHSQSWTFDTCQNLHFGKYVPMTVCIWVCLFGYPDGRSRITREHLNISSSNFTHMCTCLSTELFIFKTVKQTNLSKCKCWPIRNLRLPFRCECYFCNTLTNSFTDHWLTYLNPPFSVSKLCLVIPNNYKSRILHQHQRKIFCRSRQLNIPHHIPVVVGNDNIGSPSHHPPTHPPTYLCTYEGCRISIHFIFVHLSQGSL